MLIREAIVTRASELFQVHPRDLLGGYRFQFVTRARFAIYLALRRRGWSYEQIGKFLGRDHSSVIHGVKRAEYMVEKDAAFAAKVTELQNITVRVADEEGQTKCD